MKSDNQIEGAQNTASPYRRWILYTFSFWTVSMVAGVVYGWPALRKQLQNEGSTLGESTMGAIFTVGSWSTQGGRLFLGLARDRFGTKWVAAFCIFCVAIGSLGVAWSDANNAVALGASLFFMGLGSGAQLCVQPVAGLFPKSSGTIVASLSGAFQISGLIFLALTSGKKSNSDTRGIIFSSFSLYLLFLAIIAIILLPSGKSFLWVETEQETNDINDSTHPTTDKKSSVSEDSVDTQSESKLKQYQVDTSLNENIEDSNGNVQATLSDTNSVDSSSSKTSPTAKEQIKTREYVFLVAWFSVCIIPLQYYIGSIGFQLEEKGDDGFYTDLFSILYASSTIASPVGGFLADKLSLGFTQGLGTWTVSASLFFLVSDFTLPGQAVGLLIYGIGRLLVFGMYFANCGKRFGYANFGTLAGLGLLISALVSLLQYPMIAASADGQSQNVNIVSGAVLLLCTPYCVWLHRQETRHPSGCP